MFDILDADVLLREKRPIVVTFPGPKRGTVYALYEQEPVFSAADSFAEFKRIVLAV
jgi:hypothetical protein